MKYSIEEPDHELTVGYFTLLIKYVSLFIVSWIAAWLIALFLPFKHTITHQSKFDMLINNPQTFSIVIAIMVVLFYSFKLYQKTKFGLIKEIEFKEDYIILTTINLINGKLSNIIINNGELKTTLIQKNHFLFGEQRVYELNEMYTKIAKFNVDMTAWVRHPEINSIIEKLEEYR